MTAQAIYDLFNLNCSISIRSWKFPTTYFIYIEKQNGNGRKMINLFTGNVSKQKNVQQHKIALLASFTRWVLKKIDKMSWTAFCFKEKLAQRRKKLEPKKFFPSHCEFMSGVY